MTETLPEPSAESPSSGPYGVDPMKGRGAVMFSWLLFLLWLVLLVLLAIRYPARG